jgi:hypothetical protein
MDRLRLSRGDRALLQSDRSCGLRQREHAVQLRLQHFPQNALLELLPEPRNRQEEGGTCEQHIARKCLQRVVEENA